MNKKLIYTGIWLCLGGLALTDSAWADANYQSMKKCPQDVLDREGAIFLTKEHPNGRVNLGDEATKPGDPTDDFYEICQSSDFNPAGCIRVTDDPLAAQALDAQQVPVVDSTGTPVYVYVDLAVIGTNNTNVIEGYYGNDEICGQSGNDTLDGLDGNDTLHGNNGNDILIGRAGDDFLFGGNGNDVIHGYNEQLGENPAEVSLVAGDGGGDFNLDGVVDALDTDGDTMEGGNGTDQLFGGPNNDTMNGGNGKDTLNGNGGDDTLDGGNSPDVLDGGEGYDTIIVGKGKDSCTDNDSDTAVNDCPQPQPKAKKGGKKK